MADVFISYKQDERDRMRPIAEALRALNVEIWFDEDLAPDRSFGEEIQHLLGACRAQLVCWSPAAVASEWVRGEAEKGRQRGALVAVMIERCDLPPPFNMHHAEDLSAWRGETDHPGWRKVLEALGRKLERPGLAELARLQGSPDPEAWKRWAQKYPADPCADAAWAQAENLVVGAAKARLAAQRDAAAGRAPRSAEAFAFAAPAQRAPARFPVRIAAGVAIAGACAFGAYQIYQSGGFASLTASGSSAAAQVEVAAAPTWRVVDVESWDVLNVRAGPDPRTPIRGVIPPNGAGVRATGEEAMYGDYLWREVAYGDVTGWVNSRYLEEEARSP